MQGLIRSLSAVVRDCGEGLSPSKQPCDCLPERLLVLGAELVDDRLGKPRVTGDVPVKLVE